MKKRAKYTLEFKREAVRLIKGGLSILVTANVWGIPKASLDNWGRFRPLFATYGIRLPYAKKASAEKRHLAGALLSPVLVGLLPVILLSRTLRGRA